MNLNKNDYSRSEMRGWFPTEAYHRRCAITGEKTLPVLNASHIKPYSKEGPHIASNGLLLRQDIHTLFDRGYITINKDHVVEVSKRIKADYGNGKEYYAYHGKPLSNIPDKIEESLDRLLDYCFDGRILPLYRKLCRYYYQIDQAAAVEYVNAYRNMWECG